MTISNETPPSEFPSDDFDTLTYTETAYVPQTGTHYFIGTHSANDNTTRSITSLKIQTTVFS